jgi:hypothetical protein
MTRLENTSLAKSVRFGRAARLLEQAEEVPRSREPSESFDRSLITLLFRSIYYCR